jgi:hypothetical protein
MKSIQEISKLTAEDLQRIGADESIPVPEDLNVRLPQRSSVRTWSIAAAAAVVIGLGWFGSSRLAQPKDTFDDPYLAYAAVEQALLKVSANVNAAADKVAESEQMFNKVNYWK